MLMVTNIYFVSDQSDSKRTPGWGYTSKVRVRERYQIVGFISSGTYGRVYKAIGRSGQHGEFAIKKWLSPPYLTTFFLTNTIL